MVVSIFFMSHLTEKVVEVVVEVIQTKMLQKIMVQ